MLSEKATQKTRCNYSLTLVVCDPENSSSWYHLFQRSVYFVYSSSSKTLVLVHRSTIWFYENFTNQAGWYVCLTVKHTRCVLFSEKRKCSTRIVQFTSKQIVHSSEILFSYQLSLLENISVLYALRINTLVFVRSCFYRTTNLYLCECARMSAKLSCESVTYNYTIIN
jgi:hypothetical protein